jgi:hypothetical protein
VPWRVGREVALEGVSVDSLRRDSHGERPHLRGNVVRRVTPLWASRRRQARLRVLLPAATVLTAAMSMTKTDVIVGAHFGRDLREVASRVFEDDTGPVIRR